jgi:hypothetical protein
MMGLQMAIFSASLRTYKSIRLRCDAQKSPFSPHPSEIYP